MCASWVNEERRVAVYLAHEIIIDRVNARRNGVGSRWHDLKPFSLDDVHRAALVGLRSLRPRRIDHNGDRRTRKLFIEQRLEHGPNEALNPHVEADRFGKYQCASARVLLSNDGGRSESKVHSHNDWANSVGNVTESRSGHMIVWPEVFVNRKTCTG